MTNESSNIDHDQIKNLLTKIMPAIVRNLLLEGRVDKDKLNDKEYMLNALEKNRDIIDELGVVLIMHEHFLKSAQDAIAANRPEVAVVLIATAIEQIINSFYREVLEEKGLLSADEITELIRTTNFAAKIGWLLAIIAEYDVENDFRKEITTVMEIRNQIVHYKAISSPMTTEHPIKQRIQEFGLDRMLELPNDLSELLGEALESVRQETPDYKIAMEAVESFLQ